MDYHKLKFFGKLLEYSEISNGLVNKETRWVVVVGMFLLTYICKRIFKVFNVILKPSSHFGSLLRC